MSASLKKSDNQAHIRVCTEFLRVTAELSPLLPIRVPVVGAVAGRTQVFHDCGRELDSI